MQGKAVSHSIDSADKPLFAGQAKTWLEERRHLYVQKAPAEMCVLYESDTEHSGVGATCKNNESKGKC